MDYKDDNLWLMQGDCLERMKEIPSGSVDMILTDLPYGTTACKWDTIVPLDEMWEQYNRIIKTNAAIVLFGTEPFSSSLRLSNSKMYRFDYIWNKKKAGNIAQSGFQPLKIHEIVSVFYKKKPTYNPQKTSLDKVQTKHLSKLSINRKDREDAGGMGGVIKYSENYEPDKKLPTSILEFSRDNYKNNIFHPTQKPVALLEYLIKTYTNEGETVLDSTMGSGSTGVACVNTSRKFIGVEMDENYFNVAKDRLLCK